MEYLNCNDDLLEGLYQMVAVAQAHFPMIFKENGSFDLLDHGVLDAADVEALIDALHVLRPDFEELGVFDAMVHAMRGRWGEAIQTLFGVVAVCPDFMLAKALLAFCQCREDMDGWRALADEVLASDCDAVARKMMKCILGYGAMRDGTVSPDRLLELSKELEDFMATEPESEAGAPDERHGHGYFSSALGVRA